jgi:hypothetical protein
MKSKDFALIASTIIFAAIVSIIASKLIFSNNSASQQVDVVPSIGYGWPTPDKRYFNSNSIDLTQFISIGNNTNPSPFGSGNANP